MNKINPSDDAIAIAAATMAAALLRGNPNVAGASLERQKDALASAFAWSVHTIQTETNIVER